MSSLNTQRIGWIDYAKSIAIFFVVLIHTHCDPYLTITLKSFTMPVFFFISGFLFSRENNPSYKKFAEKRFRQLIIPYIWINLMAYLLWLFFLRHYGADAESYGAWHKPLIGIILGLPPALIHDIPLWSLLSFFVVEMIYYPLQRKTIKNDIIIAFIFFVLASILAVVSDNEGMILPVSLAPSLAAMIFYALGHYCRINNKKLQLYFQPNFAVLLLSIAIIALGVKYNSPVSFFLGKIGNPIWFLCAALGGIIFVVQISSFLSSFARDPRFIRFISRGTLLICGFHLIVLAGIKGILYFIFKVNPVFLTDNVLNGIATSIVIVVVCLPIIYLVERYARFLVSK